MDRDASRGLEHAVAGTCQDGVRPVHVRQYYYVCMPYIYGIYTVSLGRVFGSDQQGLMPIKCHHLLKALQNLTATGKCVAVSDRRLARRVTQRKYVRVRTMSYLGQCEDQITPARCQWRVSSLMTQCCRDPMNAEVAKDDWLKTGGCILGWSARNSYRTTSVIRRPSPMIHGVCVCSGPESAPWI